MQNEVKTLKELSIDVIIRHNFFNKKILHIPTEMKELINATKEKKLHEEKLISANLLQIERKNCFLKNWSLAMLLRQAAKAGKISVFDNNEILKIVEAVHPMLGGSALFIASINGRTEFLKKLIDAGASLDYQGNDMAKHPLMGALVYDKMDCFQLLLSRNISYDAIEKDELIKKAGELKREGYCSLLTSSQESAAIKPPTYP